MFLRCAVWLANDLYHTGRYAIQVYTFALMLMLM